MSYWDSKEGEIFLVDPTAHENKKRREKLSEKDLKALAYEDKSKEPVLNVFPAMSGNNLANSKHESHEAA